MAMSLSATIGYLYTLVLAMIFMTTKNMKIKRTVGLIIAISIAAMIYYEL
ncbi:MAG: hypothetical protein AB8C84_08950 [Oligoflexales bacterium]